MRCPSAPQVMEKESVEQVRKWAVSPSGQKAEADTQTRSEEALAAVDSEYGAADTGVVPPLAVLAVRELHRQGHECAEGTADPSEVAVKLTAAGLV